MTLKRTLLSLVAAFGLLLGTAHADVPKNIVDSIRANVVHIFNGPKTGTGFFITPQYIMTNKHVISIGDTVDGDAQISTRSVDGEERFVVRMFTTAAEIDLAILYCSSCPADSGKGIALFNGVPVLGTSVWGAGFGLGFFGIQDGYTMITETDPDGVWWTHHSAPSAAGDSGGPLLAIVGGKVVVMGVRTAVRLDRIPASGESHVVMVFHKGLAVPSTRVVQFAKASMRGK